MRKIRSSALWAVVMGLAGLGLSACQSPAAPPPTPLPSVPGAMGAPGSDRDPHGCIPSAGYRWCPAQARCVRPWELPAQAGEAAAMTFERVCTPP